MHLTHRARSLLAGPRREFGAVLAIMALVLAVIGVHVVCSVHLDERAGGAGHAHQAGAEASGHHVVAAIDHHEVAAGMELAAGVGTEAAVEPLVADPHCADHGTVTAHGDPVRAVPQGPAVVPDLAVRWLVPALADHEPSTPSGVAAVAAPSLHALGISRT